MMLDFMTLDGMVDKHPRAVLTMLSEAALSQRDKQILTDACRQRIEEQGANTAEAA